VGRPKQCADLILEGHALSEIAAELHISSNSVVQYLYSALGMGLIDILDIVVTIPEDTRCAIERIITDFGTDYYPIVHKEVEDRHIDIDRAELQLYLRVRGKYIGDLYFFIADLERSLHSLIQTVLEAEFGSDYRWWNLTVPESIKQECQQRHQRDRNPADHPYSYTSFLQLRDIIDSNWNTFQGYLPEAESLDRRALMRALSAANAVRNKVMHPVRESMPSNEEFLSVLGLSVRLARQNWKLPS